jgi:hypothetical protein
VTGLLDDLDEQCGVITADEAEQIAERYRNQQFKREGEKPRASIPANPQWDDDIRLLVFIRRVAPLIDAAVRATSETHDALELARLERDEAHDAIDSLHDQVIALERVGSDGFSTDYVRISDVLAILHATIASQDRSRMPAITLLDDQPGEPE